MIAVLGAGTAPGRAFAAEEALRRGAGFPEVAALAAQPARDDWRRALVADLVRRALSDAEELTSRGRGVGS
jgi:hypothetical protein